MMDIRGGQIAQNNYSAQSCVNGSDCQNKAELKTSKNGIEFPLEKRQDQAPFVGRELTTVSTETPGECRYLTGTPGHFRCTCKHTWQCPKFGLIACKRVDPLCFTIGEKDLVFPGGRAS